MLMQHLTVQQIFTAQPAIAQAPRLHVAIISDGNGRWASSRGLPRSAGHRAGAEVARQVIAAAPRLGIHTLTLFALSSANWKRPAAEVNAILRLLHEYLLTEAIAQIFGRKPPDEIRATARGIWNNHLDRPLRPGLRSRDFGRDQNDAERKHKLQKNCAHR